MSKPRKPGSSAEIERLKGLLKHSNEVNEELRDDLTFARAGIVEALRGCDAIAAHGGLIRWATSSQRSRLEALARGDVWECQGEECHVCQRTGCPAMLKQGDKR